MATTKKTKEITEEQTSKQSSEVDPAQAYWDKLNTTEPAAAPPTLPVKVDTKVIHELTHLYDQKDKIALLEWNKNLSLEKIVEEGKSKQISVYRSQCPQEIDRLLKHMLVDFAAGFSINNNLSSEQIREIAAEIQVNYWHLSIEDIAIFLKQVKKGQFAEQIYSLDTNRILTWMEKYDQQRTELMIAKRQSDSASLRHDPYPRRKDSIKAGENAALVTTAIHNTKRKKK